MKRIAFLVGSAFLLLSGFSAFASEYRPMDPTSQVVVASAAASAQETMVATAPSWEGMTASQLIQQLGEPNFKSVAANGDTIYDFNRPAGIVQGRTSLTQLEFVLDGSGVVVSESSSWLG